MRLHDPVGQQETGGGARATDGAEREAQQANAALLKAKFRDAGLPVMDSTTHIVPLMVGDPVLAKKIADVPNSERYPWEDMVDKYGPYFMNSSLSWMFALALDKPVAFVDHVLAHAFAGSWGKKSAYPFIALPDGAFAGSGTNVSTVIIVLEKPK